MLLRLYSVREKVDAQLMACLVGMLAPTFDAEYHPGWEWFSPDEIETLRLVLAELRSIKPQPTHPGSAPLKYARQNPNHARPSSKTSDSARKQSQVEVAVHSELEGNYEPLYGVTCANMRYVFSTL